MKVRRLTAGGRHMIKIANLDEPRHVVIPVDENSITDGVAHPWQITFFNWYQISAQADDKLTTICTQPGYTDKFDAFVQPQDTVIGQFEDGIQQRGRIVIRGEDVHKDFFYAIQRAEVVGRGAAIGV